jgi:hypothetical protein
MTSITANHKSKRFAALAQPSRLSLAASFGLLSLLLPAAVTLPPAPAQAGTCASNCGPKPVRFIPGELVKVELINRTAGIILLEEVQGSDPIPVSPTRNFRLTRQGGTTDNSSVVFWDAQGFPLEIKLSQPQKDLLRIEVKPGYRVPGDRSIYLQDDGSVQIL